MDDYTAARFADAYERPYPEDHPRCDGCSEHLHEDEMEHDGNTDLCDDCGIVCDACNEKAFNKEMTDGTSYHKEVKNLCIYCIEQVNEGELEPDEIQPMY